MRVQFFYILPEFGYLLEPVVEIWRFVLLCLHFPDPGKFVSFFSLKTMDIGQSQKHIFKSKRGEILPHKKTPDFWPDLSTYYITTEEFNVTMMGGNDFQCRTRPQRSFLEERRIFLRRKCSE